MYYGETSNIIYINPYSDKQIFKILKTLTKRNNK